MGSVVTHFIYSRAIQMDFLNRPLYERIDSLSAFVNTASVQELQSRYIDIISNICNLDNPDNWNLLNLTKAKDFIIFDKAHNFLKPNGVLLNAINSKLTSDSSLKFEFSSTRLSDRTQLSIRRAIVKPFIMNKLLFQTSNDGPSNLSLNAFEYFFFNFFYLVNQHKLKEPLQNSCASESLYFTLAMDFFNHFLITEPHCGKLQTLATPLVHHHRSSPVSPSSRFNTYSVTVNRRLLRSIENQQDPLTRQRPLELTDVWQTDTIIQLAIEFWINTSFLEAPLINPRDELWYWPGKICLPFANHCLPSADQVMLVRIFLKYVYFFIHGQSLKQNAGSPAHHSFLTRLEEYKKSLFTSYISPGLEAFFRNCFRHWPYDTSFRLVLETWLTFVQPWRYVDGPVHEGNDDSSSILIGSDWLPFIQEEYFFYSTFFRDFLQRAKRVDLGVDRNAALLYRVMKVFSNDSFRQLLRCAEDRLFRSGRPTTSPPLPVVLARSEPSFAPNVDAAGAEMLTTGRGARTPSLWSAEVLGAAAELRARLEAALFRLQEISRSADSPGLAGAAPTSGPGTSRWGWLMEGLSELTAAPRTDCGRASEREEREKCVYYLQQAADNLRQFFQGYDLDGSLNVTPPFGFGDHNHSFGNSFVASSPRHSASSSEDSFPECLQTPQGTVLTPRGRFQLVNGTRRFPRFEYENDPDLQPVRSFELAILVRATQELSDYINHRFGSNLYELCRRPGFWGQWARHLFLLEVSEQRQQASAVFSPISPRQMRLRNEPRVRLRWMANARFLGTLALTYFLCRALLGIRSLLLFFFLALLFTFLHSVIQVVLKEKANSRRSRTD